MANGISIVEGCGFLEIHLDRPDKKNALTVAMYREMTAALDRASRSDSIEVVLIAAAGDGFCSGNDLRDFLEMDPDEPGAMEFITAIAGFDKLLVAAVQGFAVGIGTTMLFHCDLVYAAPDASFVMPFVNLGLVPEAGSSLAAPAMFGRAKAARMLLLGEPMSAAEAERAGLVSEIVPADALLAHARGKVAALLTKAPRALAQTRKLLRGDTGPMHARIEQEIGLFREALRSSEAKEAFSAFLEKRKPRFRPD